MLTRITTVLTLVLLLVTMPAVAQDTTPTEAPLPSETPLPTLTPTDIPTPVPTETPTIEPTATEAATSSPTETPTVMDTPTETLAISETATSTTSLSETASPSPTLIETPSATATLSPSPFPIATATRTVIPTGTPNAHELTRAAEPSFRALSAPQVIDRFVFGGNVTELIDAIDDANNDPNNIYVIHLGSGTYTLDNLHRSPLTPDYFSYMPILGQVVIVGNESYSLGIHPSDLLDSNNGSAVFVTTIARADNSDQLDLFHVSGGSLTLYNVIVRNGGGPDRWGGGGFVVWGSLNLYNTLIDDNFVSTYGGAIYNESGGVVTSSNTIFRTNNAFAAGGGRTTLRGGRVF